jgi:hypothetical protein
MTTGELKMINYQLKLDFGEGQICHLAYEKFLEENKLQDTPKLWVIFTTSWAKAEQDYGVKI